MKNAKGVSILADPQAAMYPVESEDEVISNVPYREAVGSLMFLAIESRPDIAYAVNSVSRFLSRHNSSYWQAVKRIFTYLVTSRRVSKSWSRVKLGWFYIETRRSTTGCVFTLANGAVTWSSQRQQSVPLSTTESEYMGQHCVVRRESERNLARNPQFHTRSKHIDMRYHYVREKVEDQQIALEYVPTAAQRADVFTKTLPKNSFLKFREGLGLRERFIERSNGGSVEVV